MIQSRQRIAVIGSGISGLASAFFLSSVHDVILFEAEGYLGGHTNTVDVTLEGQTHPVDTGFLVFNEQTYPNFIAFLAELNTRSYESDMSFGVSLNDGELEWAGTNIGSVFAQRKNLLSPQFLIMLKDILRFNRSAESHLAVVNISGATLGQLLDDGNYSTMFRDGYLLPMSAAIWSSSPQDILQFPASTFLQFCLNHALLQVNDRPKWHTVKGGGRAYVNQIKNTISEYRLNTKVHRIERTDDGVLVTSDIGIEKFDSVVCATHAPQTLEMLVDASETERKILSSVRYQTNSAILHTDIKQMPKRKKVWSAWNYLGGRRVDGQRPVCVSYWLNQLQNLPFQTSVILTLNPFELPQASSILAQFEYQHPIFDHAAILAQQQLPTIQGKKRVWFAGAWTGYGFHEDGLKSALRVVADFNISPPWAKV
ncbi:NAD(P)/FAD-dependent oxidoreductase [Aquirhabdus parva]|uniref:NAD/FAD-binding protein n=1 Tax=Aquirhabdus parva TaxID=2283318 RepID=A0A345PBA3_9GAMM|nr:FAD-dependent oxidoreductase [Aquirhabdus parva]AXI04562.1 NAD/FAD-binding protein [Aquirhabdus parva]